MDARIAAAGMLARSAEKAEEALEAALAQRDAARADAAHFRQEASALREQTGRETREGAADRERAVASALSSGDSVAAMLSERVAALTEDNIREEEKSDDLSRRLAKVSATLKGTAAAKDKACAALEARAREMQEMEARLTGALDAQVAEAEAAREAREEKAEKDVGKAVAEVVERLAAAEALAEAERAEVKRKEEKARKDAAGRQAAMREAGKHREESLRAQANPSTLHPKSSTLPPPLDACYTLNPKASTLNPQPSTLNPKP